MQCVNVGLWARELIKVKSRREDVMGQSDFLSSSDHEMLPKTSLSGEKLLKRGFCFTSEQRSSLPHHIQPLVMQKARTKSIRQTFVLSCSCTLKGNQQKPLRMFYYDLCHHAGLQVLQAHWEQCEHPGSPWGKGRNGAEKSGSSAHKLIFFSKWIGTWF